MWTFFDGIMKEIATQTVSFLQTTAGSQRALKKKYSQLKERVKCAIWTNISSDILACYGSPVVVLNDKNSF